MPYKVNRLKTRHALVDKHVTLPINVLLALPEPPEKTAVAGLFNLPAAINLLLGGPGWERAKTVMHPTLLAPGWRADQLLDFVYESAVPPRRQAIPAEELVRQRIEASILREASASRTPSHRFAIRHYAAGRATDGTEAPVEWLPTIRNWLSDFLRLAQRNAMVSDAIDVPAFDRDTRLVVFQTHADGLAKAQPLAEWTLFLKGPAVLLVASDAPAQANEYLTDFYAQIIHNKPLSEAAKPQKPYAIEAELWLGEGGDELLSFDRWVQQLQDRVAALDSRHAAFRNALRRQQEEFEPYFHRAMIGPELREIDQKSGAAAMQISALKGSLNFARETEGVYPLLDLSNALPDMEGRVADLYPELENVESRLRSGAYRGPRVLNANFADPSTRKLLGSREAMAAGEPYHLLVDVGPRWSKAKSIVRGNAEFPEKAMPEEGEGFPVQVLLIGEDFVPRMSSTWIWVPRTRGRSVPYDSLEIPSGKAPAGRPKKNKAGPAVLSIVAPKLADSDDNSPKDVSARLCLYYEGNLLQSARVRIGIVRGRDPVRLEDKNEIRVDYALTNTLVDVAARCAPRALSFTDSKEQKAGHPVNLNIALNDNGQGGHRIIMVGRPGSEVPAAGWAQYNPQGATDVLAAARSELLDCFFLRDAEGAADRQSNGLNGSNGKSFDQFRFDLRELAKVGSALYTMITGQIQVEEDAYIPPAQWARDLKAALAKSNVIQVARTVRAEYALPWALMYDIPMPGPTFSFCKVLSEWQNGVRANAHMLDRCPYADEPRHQQNVFCPYGFWGLKHIIEQPPAQIAMRKDGRWEPVDVERQFAKSAAIDFAVAITRDATLDSQRIGAHLRALSQIPRVKLCPPSPADDTNSACQAMASPDVVYFLCHGDIDKTPPLPRPYIGIGLPDGNPSHMIYVGTVQGWTDATATPNLSEWSRRRPLVFINGCDTANLNPREMLNFVSGFSYARASGVIGTEVSVKVPVAAEAASIFLEKLFRGVPAGQALREMRWQLANKGNLLGLAYTLYAMADLRTHAVH